VTAIEELCEYIEHPPGRQHIVDTVVLACAAILELADRLNTLEAKLADLAHAPLSTEPPDAPPGAREVDDFHSLCTNPR